MPWVKTFCGGNCCRGRRGFCAQLSSVMHGLCALIADNQRLSSVCQKVGGHPGAHLAQTNHPYLHAAACAMIIDPNSELFLADELINDKNSLLRLHSRSLRDATAPSSFV